VQDVLPAQPVVGPQEPVPESVESVPHCPRPIGRTQGVGVTGSSRRSRVSARLLAVRWLGQHKTSPPHHAHSTSWT